MSVEEIKFPPQEQEYDDEEKSNNKCKKYLNDTVMDYLELDSKDIESTIGIYLENRQLFYSLWKDVKDLLYDSIGAKARQAELIMIYWGNKKFYEIFSKYDIRYILKFYDKLFLYFSEVPGIYRVPALNLSTMFNSKRQDRIFVHTNMKLYGELKDKSESFDISIGDITMIDIILFLSDFYIDTYNKHFDNRTMEFLRIADRLKNNLEDYSYDIAKHLASLIPDIEKDVKRYARDVESGDGHPETLKEKEKILGKILKTIKQRPLLTRNGRKLYDDDEVTEVHSEEK